MVPEGWKVKSLGEICNKELQTGPFGSQLYAHEYVDIGIPVVMPKDLNDGKADLHSAAKITEEKASILKKHKLREGDLLFSRRGDVARFALIDRASEGSLCGTGCLRARPSNEHSAKFLAYFLQKDSVRKWLEQNAVGQTMLNMNTEILGELPLMSASSKNEEDKIAEILSTWDKAIATTQRLLANSQQQKKALIQQLVTGKKRFPEFEGEWKKIKLAAVSDMNSGGTPRSSIEEYYNGGIPWVSIADMTSKGKWIYTTDKTLSEKGLKNSSARLYSENTILYAMYASIGECSIARVPLCSSQAILGIRPKKELHYEYLYFFLSSMKEKIKLQGQQGTQSNLNAGMVKDFIINLPSIEEQKIISSVLNLSDQEIELLQQKLNHLKQEKKALMQQLLTGKRRVKVEAA
jgi:type I restriction enzyme S subunit